ncbi:DNA-binding transcriptional regulator, MarR family [Halobacillus karajensis]|uniref:Transcriptional regulator n=1 Tax=Halobacillus karajensis TaxID=195088 RepID=A0A024P8R2_9BACI|nr:MarR family transcriptional regulator [Halobacillus karajensis]CDQ20211.1 putative transcriptional regulator [Halobacillus karajensis]CDQ25126.1 putative transcriptional regulator [Halobacillus karajensis]CDQ28513.1 putative transcriptional regulator [Halobacillus karajensis]SEI02007.1 DNA-binding transcriptional regulator, MarR family [Halobacillus karajensis]
MSNESLELIEQQVTDFIRRIILTEKRHDNLDRSAYILLRQLSSYGPAGVKSLAADLHLDISTVSRQAAALVEKKYVEKVANPIDRRAYFYQITELGLNELEENKRRRYHRLAGILEEWTEDEKEKFGHLLQKYNQTVNQKMNRKE